MLTAMLWAHPSDLLDALLREPESSGEEVDSKLEEWELVAEDGSRRRLDRESSWIVQETHRLSVPGGWLYRLTTIHTKLRDIAASATMTFVPKEECPAHAKREEA